MSEWLGCAVSDESIVDCLGADEGATGAVTDSLTAATGYAGPADAAIAAQALGSSRAAAGLTNSAGSLASRGWQAAGGSGVSTALSVLSGVNTFANHDPSIHGAGSLVERTTMGVIDGAWGVLGGPWAVADAVTGGNVAGGMKALAGLALTSQDQTRTGDDSAYQRHVDSMIDGNFGALAGLGGVAIDAVEQIESMGTAALMGDEVADFDGDGWDRYSDAILDGSMGGVMGAVGVGVDAVAQGGGMLWDAITGDDARDYDSTNAETYWDSMKEAGPFSPFAWLANATDDSQVIE